jgi:hypothetical protein
MGVIARDSKSEICMATVGALHMMVDALQAEAIALSIDIQIADQMGMDRVIFETDCLNLKHAMMTADYSFSFIGTLISDMKFQIQMNFIEARVVFSSRGCNKSAHELAAMGVGEVLDNHVIWTSNFPTDVTRLVTSDCAVS